MLREELLVIQRQEGKSQSMNKFIAYKLSIHLGAESVLFSALIIKPCIHQHSTAGLREEFVGPVSGLFLKAAFAEVQTQMRVLAILFSERLSILAKQASSF